MKAALAAMDVDVAQWRALTRVLLKNDFDALLGARGLTAAKRGATSFFAFLTYILAGLFPAFMVRISPDVLLGATMMTTMVMFMVASSLLLGDGVAIASPDDFGILGFRPVSSRTYLAARVSTMSIRTLGIGALVGGPPVLAFAFKGGFPLAGAAAGSVFATALATTFAIVAMYGWLLRLVGPRRLTRLMSYAQLAANFVVWGGFVAASQGMQKQLLEGLRLDSASLIVGYPGCWFASWVDLANGAADAPRLIAAALSVFTVGALSWSIGGRLSLDYSDRLAALATASTPSRTRDRGRMRAPWLGFLRGEGRAVAILVRSHFRDDTRFRIAIISLVPMTALYMFMGLRGGAPPDPFVAGAKGGDPAFFLQFVLFFLPFMLRQTMTYSDAYESSWIFHTTPADRARLVTASRNVVAIGFLLPYLCFIAVLFAWLFHNAGHAVLHTIFLGSMSWLVLQVTVLADPDLPFSRPPARQARGGMTIGVIMVATIFGIAGYMVITRFVYRSPVAMVATLAVFCGLSLLLSALTRGRARRRMAEPN